MRKEIGEKDRLAENRTHLANERTLLAYWRTALSFLVLGAFLIKFIPSVHSKILVILSIFFGIGLFVYGIARYIKYKEKINHNGI
jgi:putative membrane protein